MSWKNRGQGDNHGFKIVLKRNNTSSGPLQKQSGKSCDFTSSSSREVENVFANQMQGWPSWISNNSEKIQLLLRTPNGKLEVSLVTGHAAVLQMKLNMRKN